MCRNIKWGVPFFEIGFNWSAPKAQLKPTLNKGICEIEIRKASTVWPESVLPDASVIVPDTMIEYQYCARLYFFYSKSAALAFNVSKMVSTNNKSLPPSILLAACTRCVNHQNLPLCNQDHLRLATCSPFCLLVLWNPQQIWAYLGFSCKCICYFTRF
jgi:hypothetical protein